MDPQASPPLVEPQEPGDQKSFPVWGPVATLAWSVLIVIAFLFVEVVVMVIFSLPMRQLPREKAEVAFMNLRFDGTFLSVYALGTLLLCVPLIIGLVKLKRGSNLKDYLGLKPPPLKQVLRWSLIALGFCFLGDALLLLLRQPIVTEYMLESHASASPQWVFWLAIVIAVPIFEEICFRGFIFKGLAASRLGWRGATIVTAVLWAAAHQQEDWYGIAIIFGLGLVLGAARAMTNSTLLTIWLHSLINLLATAQTAFVLLQQS